MIRPLIALALALAAVAASAQQTRSLAPGAAPAPATLADLGWITGSWAGEQAGGGFAGETYSAAAGGQITGHFFQTRAGQVSMMELIQIVEQDGTLVYRLRHFNRDFSGWEDKTGKAVEFKLIAIEGKRFYFDGITLDATTPDRMDFWVRIGGKDGGTREVLYRYSRMPASR